MKIILCAAAAGVAGTLLRFGVTRLAERWLPGFPLGTLFVNVVGAFLAGFCFIWCRSRFPQLEAWFPVLFIGFLGAFTTFSTFALESSRFLLDGRSALFAVNVLLQNLFGIAAAAGGILLARGCCR